MTIYQRMVMDRPELKDCDERQLCRSNCPNHYAGKPDYCKGDSTSVLDCCRCWNREFKENQNIKNDQEGKSMSEELEKAETTGISEVNSRRQCAEKLHNQIIYNAGMVYDYLIELCKGLKRMRDERLFTELGYDTFDDYAEKDVGIKKRQAYTYISTYERLGDRLLQSNAHLGITKLSLLTEVPATDRTDFIENNDLEKMSTREIKEMAEKLKDKGEQLSLMTEERDKAKTEADKSSDEVEQVKKAKEAAEKASADAIVKLANAQKRITELEKVQPDTETLERLKHDAEKAASKGIKDKIKVEAEKAVAAAKADYDKKVANARAEGEKSGAEKIKASLESLEKEKADALHKSEELEKKLRVSSNQDTALFAYLFENFQECFNKLCGCIKKIEASDEETAKKLSGAMAKVVDNMRQDEMLKNQ